MMNFNEVWTEPRVELLTTAWKAGLSAGKIADQLGCFSHCDDGGRSAVLGKIHRLKLLAPEGKRVKSGPRKRAEPKPATPPPAARLRNGYDPALRRNPSHNILAAIAIAGTEPGLPEKLKGEAPDGTGVKLVGLDKSTCRWPRGNPGDENFEFCGGYALEGLPYCAGHSRLAYLPTQSRNRAMQKNGD